MVHAIEPFGSPSLLSCLLIVAGQVDNTPHKNLLRIYSPSPNGDPIPVWPYKMHEDDKPVGTRGWPRPLRRVSRRKLAVHSAPTPNLTQPSLLGPNSRARMQYFSPAARTVLTVDSRSIKISPKPI